MPNGLAGLWDDYAKPWLHGAKKRLMERPPVDVGETKSNAPLAKII
jgi:hypothetical protein